MRNCEEQIFDLNIDKESCFRSNLADTKMVLKGGLEPP